MSLIKQSKSIIPALDVCEIDIATEIVKQSTDNEKVGAYKIGFSLALPYGLNRVINELRLHTDKPFIYDHQKAATDIPDTGKMFARCCRESGVNSVILFPLSGPDTQEAWIKACQDEGLHVIVGGMMTHPNFLDEEGKGYIHITSPEKIYDMAAMLGVENFVVPGNQPEFIRLFKENFPNSTLYSPGLVSQGGDISESGKIAGDNWHAIVGRAITKAEPKKISSKVQELVGQL